VAANSVGHFKAWCTAEMRPDATVRGEAKRDVIPISLWQTCQV